MTPLGRIWAFFASVTFGVAIGESIRGEVMPLYFPLAYLACAAIATAVVLIYRLGKRSAEKSINTTKDTQ